MTVFMLLFCGSAMALEHSTNCGCPDGIPKEPANWQWVSQPTCQSLGEKVGRCAVCNYHVSISIACVPHEYLGATCTTPEICRFGCGATREEPLGHDFPEITCQIPRFCQRQGCNAQDNTQGDHLFNNPTCQDMKTCTICGYISSYPGDHNYASATCTSPKRCIYCGATTGTSLGHKYLPATCTSLSICIRCGATTGTYAPHQYVNDVCIVCGRIQSIQDKMHQESE